jgi:hypothetical protein
MTCLEEYMSGTSVQSYVFRTICSRILHMVFKNVMNIISDELYYITVPSFKLNNSFTDSNKIKTLNFIGAFPSILKTLLNLQFSTVAVLIRWAG